MIDYDKLDLRAIFRVLIYENIIGTSYIIGFKYFELCN